MSAAQHHPEREVFENFFQAWPREWCDERFKLDGTGGYLDIDTHNAWIAWEERAAIAGQALSRTVVSYADLRRAEKECDPATPVVTNVGFLCALRKGADSRDDFAKAALQGICAHSDTWGLKTPEVADMAYELANEMLRAREE